MDICARTKSSGARVSQLFPDMQDKPEKTNINIIISGRLKITIQN
jgi:hypothetical protein